MYIFIITFPPPPPQQVRRKLSGQHLALDRATWGDFVDETRELCLACWVVIRRYLYRYA